MAPFSDDFRERYHILRCLGEGAFGRVYEAHQAALGRRVAVKCLTCRRDGDDGLQRRFEREARILAELSHPNIVKLYDYGIDEGVPYLVEELLEGETLAEVMHHEGPLPVERVVALGRQMAAALACAHEHGVIHRDLKPANVMVRPDGTVTVLDFGLAAADDDVTAITATGAVIGTYRYMAPEQLLGRHATAASDVYALAVTLYHLVSGAFPHDFDTPSTSLVKTTVPPRPLGSCRPDLPPAFCRVIDEALVTDPSRRTADAAAFGRALAAGPDETPSVIDGPAPRRGPWPVLAVLGLVTLVGWWFFRPDGDPAPVAPFRVELDAAGPTTLLCSVTRPRPAVMQVDVVTATADRAVGRFRSRGSVASWSGRLEPLPAAETLRVTVTAASRDGSLMTTSVTTTTPPVSRDPLGPDLWALSGRRHPLDAGSAITGPPCVTASGTYIGLGSRLVCVDPSWRLRWTARAPAIIDCVTATGSRVLARFRGGVASFAAGDGTRQWHTPWWTDDGRHMAVGDDLVVAEYDGKGWAAFRCSDGTAVWTLSPSNLQRPYTVVEGTRLVAQTSLFETVVVELPSGRSLGRLPMLPQAAQLVTPFTPIPGGLVVGMDSGRVVGLTPFATPTFDVTVEGIPKMFAADEERLYVCTIMPDALIAIDRPRGTTTWRRPLDVAVARTGRTMVRSATLLAHRSRLYLLDERAAVHCLQAATGQPLWTAAVQADAGFGLLPTPRGVLVAANRFQPTVLDDESASCPSMPPESTEIPGPSSRDLGRSNE